MNEFGKHLEELRGKLSLREASERIGVSHTYIRDLELGKKKEPTRETLEKIAKAYNVPYFDLYEKAGYHDETKKKEDKLNTAINTIEELYPFLLVKSGINQTLKYKGAKFEEEDFIRLEAYLDGLFAGRITNND